MDETEEADAKVKRQTVDTPLACEVFENQLSTTLTNAQRVINTPNAIHGSSTQITCVNGVCAEDTSGVESNLDQTQATVATASASGVLYGNRRMKEKGVTLVLPSGEKFSLPRREHCSNSMSEVENEFLDMDINDKDLMSEDSTTTVDDMEVLYPRLQRYDAHSLGIERSQGRQRRTKSLYGVRTSCKFGPKAKSSTDVITIQDPGSQRLTWYKPPLTVLVIKKIFDDKIIRPFTDLILWLIKDKQMVVFVEAKVMKDPKMHADVCFSDVKSKLCTFKEGEDDLHDKIDLIICLGGDGTLIYISSLFQQSVPPVMAFHLGSLGFLSPFDITNATKEVSNVLQGNVSLTLRTRLKCVIRKKGSENDTNYSCSIKNVESKQHILVINEVVVDRGPSPYLCNLDLYIEHKYITSVQGDGLIISTPTGSTAYAAAAGASMIHPNVPAILIAPICVHSLSFRPIVVPAGVEIKIMVSEAARNDAWVSFDGRRRQPIVKGDTLRISTSIYPVPSICSEDPISDWFDSLARCLNWSARKQQLAFTEPDDDDDEYE